MTQIPRDNFRALLAECTFINADTRLKDVKKEHGEDERWKECDDADKEQLLEDRVSDMRREKKEADRKRKSELLEALAKYLTGECFGWLLNRCVVVHLGMGFHGC